MAKKTKIDKIFSPAEHRVPPGSGRASGTFAPGRVTDHSSSDQGRGSGGGSSGGGGGGGGAAGGRGGGGGAVGAGDTKPEAAQDRHAAAMAAMDEQQADQIRAQIQQLKADLKNITQEIKFWSTPFKPSATSGSTVTSGGAAGGGNATNTPTAGAGSTVSSGGSAGSSGTSGSTTQTFAQWLQGLKDQRAALEDHIDELQQSVRALEERAAEWMRQSKAEAPEVVKDEPDEISLTVGQLSALMECLT